MTSVVICGPGLESGTLKLNMFGRTHALVRFGKYKALQKIR